MPSNQPPNALPNQEAIKAEPSVPPIYPTNDVKPNVPQDNASAPYGTPGYNYNQPNTSAYPEQGANGNYPCQYPFPPHLETKPPLDSAGSNSPVTSWPITELKTEVSKLKLEEKAEIKSESDGEVKIEDLDTKKIVKDESKKDPRSETPAVTDNKTEMDKKDTSSKKDNGKADKSESESEEELPKRRGRKPKQNNDKAKGKSKAKPRGRKDRKTSKDKNKDDKENSDSEESEKEEKLSREEELALSKKAEELTYDWAAELLKDYVPGIIENSAKMELFFYILNESIKMGDRLLLFSQSLFTLNLIEDFLERNYIPGKNCVWERNVNYYRLDGSTHALEREKLINEFNANPNIYLFLVSTRAGSLGINLVGANRVIVFDASWNPCHDTQAVCRVYRYGQKKPCFVYRFVMDWCLEKKIYDRQINKQGMADRVVDECNPDAVLSMKEITNLCFDNDEKETEPKDLTEHLDRYLDVLMQGILTHYGRKLSKEPFQHESLLVDRKEKKLSSAEKRLAQRGYELEKKAALAPKPTTAYRTVRAADGSLVQRPVASVRPMQHGARWIPADVWRRQGMTAQEMTLPLDVVIPTNSAEKTNIVLKAGQRVMVLKSPKGIYMQLESGKIIAIKTSFKGLAGQKPDGKDSAIGKKARDGAQVMYHHSDRLSACRLKTNTVLLAGQRVMVLKSPKGIYMQLESGKIIAIKTSFKGLAGQKPGGKDSNIGKKARDGGQVMYHHSDRLSACRLKTNTVLLAGERVMVLKSPKGIYMQLESGKIIAIKTSFKGLAGQKPDGKDSAIGKKARDGAQVMYHHSDRLSVYRLKDQHSPVGRSARDGAQVMYHHSDRLSVYRLKDQHSPVGRSARDGAQVMYHHSDRLSACRLKDQHSPLGRSARDGAQVMYHHSDRLSACRLKTNTVLLAGERVMVLKSPKGIYMQLESGKIIAIKTSFKGLAGQKPDGKDSAIGKKVCRLKTNTVLLAGERVMVLKSPKGIYMQLESGKIIAIKTSFKGLAGQKPDGKDSNIGKKVLLAGERVMVLKSPKGIYMQLESGKIIAIKTSFKGLAGQKPDGKDSNIGKKVLGGRPSAAIPGSLKNNSAITITSKSAPNRPGFHRIMNRPNLPGQKLGRPLMPGQKIAEIRNRLGEMRSYTGVRPKFQGHPGKMLRPNLPGSVSITKIPRDPKRGDDKKMEIDSEPETQVLDSDDDDGKDTDKSSDNKSVEKKSDENSEEPQSSNSSDKTEENKQPSKPIVLTTDEQLPSEEALDNKSTKPESTKASKTPKQDPPKFQQNETVRTNQQMPPSQQEMPKTSHHDMPATQQGEQQNSQLEDVIKMQQIDAEKEGSEKKINPLKNYRHQRPVGRSSTESSLSILERTASVLNKESMPDFRKNLDDITQSYSPGPDEKPTAKSKKKKSPNKDTESQNDKQSSSGMSHSISSMLGNSKDKLAPNTAPVAPLGQSPRISPGVSPGLPHDMRSLTHPMKPMGHMMGPGSPAVPDMPTHPPSVPAMPVNPGPAPGQAYPAGHPPQAPEGHYGQYPPGYGMGYGGYPNAPPYYGGYGGAAPYYPGVPGYAAPGAPPAPYAPPAAAPPPEGYLPPNPQW
ncbi:helicase ARIP4 [Phthorimaea operculella]|nr:helicase ARIP4 [Phthorimaea operculella]